VTADDGARRGLPTPGEAAAARFFGLDSRGARAFVAGIVAVVTLVGGAWLLISSLAGVAATSGLLADGVHTRAEVASVEVSVPNPVGAPDDEIVTTTVEFTTPSGESVEAVLPATGVQREYPEGSSVAIVYLPDEPRIVAIDTPDLGGNAWPPVVWAIVVLVFGVLATVLCVRFARRPRAD
jgi:hypothetical protein